MFNVKLCSGLENISLTCRTSGSIFEPEPEPTVMRKAVVLVLVILAILPASFAQLTSIKGTVIDTTEDRNLSNSVVSILRNSDSVLVGFARTDAQGQFSIKNVKPGQYIVMITYPKMADFVDHLKITGASDTTLGKVILTPKSELLKEVVVRQRLGAIRMKGDTLAFMADSFKVREGASVEDLLKKLPGLQVNKNGEITAQGEKVQKVLVDGEEFFSDDPAVVTQNLRADAVKEVQVFDKKSDQAAFTGVDDGEKMKTINLKLKDDRKKGMFGKLSLGGGTPNSFSNEAMLNAFKGKRKLAGFGIMSNTGKVGLSWQDSDKFGSNNFEYNEEEGYFFSSYTGDEDFGDNWGGTFSGQGLPTAWTGGAHFSNKWDEDKFHINGNYRFNKHNIIGTTSSVSQYLLPDTTYFINQRQNIYRSNQRHGLTGSYEIKLDSTSTLKISINGTTTTARNNSRYFSEALNEDTLHVNRSNRHVTSVAEKELFNSSIIWRKRFKKKGRSISWNFDEQYNSNETNAFVNSQNEFFDDGVFDYVDSIDQQKINRSKTLALSTRISYTEPISKSTFIEVNYSYRVNNSEALRSTFDKSNNGKYEILNPVFSNDYDFRINTNSGGMNFRVNKTRFNMSIGGNVSHAAFRQTDLVKDSVAKYSFTNLFPRANIRLNFSQQSRLSLNYNGNTRQPTLEQLQPIRENTDPLNIVVGNPDLVQEFRHSINLNFNQYKVLTSRNIYVGINYSFVENAISSSSTVDTLGRRTTQYLNVNGNYNGNLWGGYWKQIKSLNLHTGMNLNLFVSRNNNFVNGLKNVNNNRGGSLGLNIGYDKEKKFSVSINPRLTYNYSRSSLRSDVVTKYWSSESEADVTVQLPWKMEVNTNANINLRQKTDVFTRDNNVIKWNAWIGKKFWKNNSGEVRLSIYDILDQNIGLTRSATSNFITENRYDTFRRYWMISFTWNFTKNPMAAAPGTTN